MSQMTKPVGGRALRVSLSIDSSFQNPPPPCVPSDFLFPGVLPESVLQRAERAGEGLGFTAVSPQVRLQHKPKGGDASTEPCGPGVPAATNGCSTRPEPLLCPAASREQRLGLGTRDWVEAVHILAVVTLKGTRSRRSCVEYHVTVVPFSSPLGVDWILKRPWLVQRIQVRFSIVTFEVPVDLDFHTL